MKKIFTTLCILGFIATAFAQAPQKMSYQTVIRNTGGSLVANSPVGIKLSVLKDSSSGSVVFSETHSPTTNAYGLASMEIGGGTPVTGTFSAISWSAGTFFVKTEIDPLGGNDYTITGTSQLLSVPYALHAKTAETVTEADGDTTNEIQALSISGGMLSLSKNGGTVEVGDSTLYSGAGGLANNSFTITTTYQPVGPAINFTKTNISSTIEAIMYSNVNGGTFSGASGVMLEIRVDGNSAARRNLGSIQTSNSTQFLSIMSVFEGLATGSHTVQVYAKTNSGTSTDLTLDPGGWGGYLFVKEVY